MSKISISDLNKNFQLSELSNTEISRINGGGGTTTVEWGFKVTHTFEHKR